MALYGPIWPYKEGDINFVFKVLAKFGDCKDNKDIKKNWNFDFFLYNALPGWLGSDERWINPTIFFKTFP